VLARVGVAVKVGEDDAAGGDAEALEALDDLQPHRPALRVDADRRAGAGVRRGRGLERRRLERRQVVVARAHLDDPAAREVGDEALRELMQLERAQRAFDAVVDLAVDARRGDDM
jgi:hypothetical protein